MTTSVNEERVRKMENSVARLETKVDRLERDVCEIKEAMQAGFEQLKTLIMKWGVGVILLCIIARAAESIGGRH